MADNENNIVTLINSEGKEVEFEEIAAIDYNGEYYAMMQPLEPLDDETDDIHFVLLFKVTKGENGKAVFEMEQDEATIEAVFAEFEKSFAEDPQ